MNKFLLRKIGMILSLPVIIFCLYILFFQDKMSFVAHGPMMPGHENLECRECHMPAPGNPRQQIQANLKYVLGMRKSPATFGYEKVSSGQCLDCHTRPNERHPIYRFREPRFIKAIEQIDARSCISCHVEHTSERVAPEVEFCSACHGEMKLKNDPLDVHHTQLVSEKRWNTCLGCHDFHGNHAVKAPVTMALRHDMERIRAYLANGKDPYADQKIHKAADYFRGSPPTRDGMGLEIDSASAKLRVNK